jgi:hypothetical protein
MVKVKRPHLIFLMETKMQQRKADSIRTKLGFAVVLWWTVKVRVEA